MESERAVFNRAVNFVLPSAIPTHLDRSQEYALGDVLVYEKKLHFLMPWRKHRLVFTGVNIAELVNEPPHDGPSLSSQLTKTMTPVFDDANTQRTFKLDAALDAEIKYAVAHFGVGVSASENATVSVDFGKVVRHFSNLPNLLNQQQFSVSTTRQLFSRQLLPAQIHPVIKDALRNNRTIFVITSLYVADKANVNVGFKSTSTDGAVDNSKLKSQQATQSTLPTNDQTAGSQAVPPAQPTTTTTVPSLTSNLLEGPGADIEVFFTSTGNSVVNRDEPTNMAYRVMRIKLGRHGVLEPQLRAGIHHVKVKVTDEAEFRDKTDPISPQLAGETQL